jgi:diguanylate cyclase (GGDEF)-like protein
MNFHVRSLRALLKPPAALGQRTRWLFLLGSLWIVGFVLVKLALGFPDQVPERLLAIGGLAWLAQAHLRTYRHGRFSIPEVLIDATVVAFAARIGGGVHPMMGLFFVPLFHRALYGAPRQAAVTVASYCAAYIAAMLLPIGGEPTPGAFEQIGSLLGITLTGSMMHIVATAMDAQVVLALESARLKEDLTTQAFHDPLTRLANRALFLERTERALEAAESTHRRVAVLFLDLDNFKLVNDSLGHAAGDELLVAFADRLLAAVRPGDTVARMGGDEFTVLLERVDDAAEALRLAQRIAAQLDAPVVLDGRSVRINVSVGVALRSADLRRAGDLLQAADVAMYVAKNRGKAQAVVFETAMASRALERFELESDLGEGLLRGEFEVYYQPLVRLEDDSIEEVEALVRWRHPRRGVILPAEFIPLAEETGLVVPLGQWVLETACQQLRTWQADGAGDPSLTISVNLSARQLRHPSLVADVRHALESTGLEPARLKLEMTESLAIADTDLNREIVWGLHALGVRLAIDDFGTGNSALEYLRRFPVDTLKIDRSFIDGLGQDERTTAIVRGMVAFAKSLDLRVTAEGVQTHDQAAELRLMGCDWGQGFLFARPLPAEKMERLLRESRRPLRLLERPAA